MRTSSLIPRARTPMPVPLRAAVAPPLPRVQAAVAAVFALDGAVFGSWAARVPDVAAAVGVGHSVLGVALLCLSIGALTAMQVTGALCARLGAGVVTTAGAFLLCVAVVLPGLATSMPGLCAALLLFGAPPAWSTCRPTPSA